MCQESSLEGRVGWGMEDIINQHRRKWKKVIQEATFRKCYIKNVNEYSHNDILTIAINNASSAQHEVKPHFSLNFQLKSHDNLYEPGKLLMHQNLHEIMLSGTSKQKYYAHIKSQNQGFKISVIKKVAFK